MLKFWVILETVDFVDVVSARIAHLPCNNPGSICYGFETYQAALEYITGNLDLS